MVGLGLAVPARTLTLKSRAGKVTADPAGRWKFTVFDRDIVTRGCFADLGFADGFCWNPDYAR